jgi:predicted homoserine dehydrogenase-like protein
MFGRSFLAQAGHVPNLRVVAVCDQNVESARQASQALGLAECDLPHCATLSAAQAAGASGKTVLVEDGHWLAELSLDVVVEATGAPEAGASHARRAIAAGKHVVMVTKETDSVVGPMLARLAADTGVVYTSGDGDQPSLLVHLIRWAEGLGFEIACAGKASESDFVYDPDTGEVQHGGQSVAVDSEALWRFGDGESAHTVVLRRQALQALSQKSVADLCEMGMVMNATGYGWDTPGLHAPIVRIPEIADVFCSRAEGGILQGEGVIDMVNCLRRPDEASIAGGVFVVVRAPDRETWQMLKRKGHVVNSRGTRALVYRPYHLLGVETATSVLAAANGRSPWRDVRPRVDLCARTTSDLKAGHTLAMQHAHSIPGLAGELHPAAPVTASNPVPFYLAAGRRLRRAVADGTLLTYDMVEVDEGSTLWELRRQQDALLQS